MNSDRSAHFMRNLAWFLLFIAVMLFFIGYFTVGYMGHNTCGMCG